MDDETCKYLCDIMKSAFQNNQVPEHLIVTDIFSANMMSFPRLQGKEIIFSIITIIPDEYSICKMTQNC